MTSNLIFPKKAYDDPAAYLTDYFGVAAIGWQSIDKQALAEASQILLEAYQNGRQVFTCGNGGSASIADHFECDHLKGVHQRTDLSPKVRSLAANTALLTATANDLSYDMVFAFALARLGERSDVLLTVSASGNSRNIIKALECARMNGLKTIALTGFDGGEAKRIADVSLHVAVDNYGIVEDIHQGIMHSLGQYIRQSRMDPNAVGVTRF